MWVNLTLKKERKIWLRFIILLFSLITEEEQGSGATSPPMGFAGMFDFFGELKRILVSLTEVASLVQHVNCDESNANAESCDMETEEPEIQVILKILIF